MMNTDDKDVSESFQKIKLFLKNPSQALTLKKLKAMLYKELSPIRTYYIENLTKEYKKVYDTENDNEKMFTKFITRIYFPKENICFLCPRIIAKEIPVIKNIIAGEYQEHSLTLKYFDSGTQFNGGQLIISKTIIKSILLPGVEKTLLDFIPRY